MCKKDFSRKTNAMGSKFWGRLLLPNREIMYKKIT